MKGMEMKKERLLQLDGLRFLMVAMIVISHFDFLLKYSYGNIWVKYFCTSTIAVDYFFMLSGFGLMYSGSLLVENEKVNIKDSILFALRRIKKIYPVYVISLMVSIPYDLYAIWGEKSYVLIIREIILFGGCLTLLQSITGTYRFTHAINAVAWFLSTLFICYMFVPILIKIVKKYCINIKKVILFLGGTIVLILFLTFFGEKIEGFVKWGDVVVFDALVYTSPWIRLLYVFIGILFAQIIIFWQEIDWRYERYVSQCEYIITFVAFVYTLFRNSIVVGTVTKRLIDVIMCGLLLMIIAMNRGLVSRWLSKDFLVRLGKNSMYLFLLHYPVVQYVKRIFAHYKIDFGELTGIVEIVIIFFGTIVFCVVVKYLNEFILRKQKND